MGTMNDPKIIAKLLRAIANAEDAKQSGQDIIFNAAAEIISPTPTQSYLDQIALETATELMKAQVDAYSGGYSQQKAAFQNIVKEALRKCLKK